MTPFRPLGPFIRIQRMDIFTLEKKLKEWLNNPEYLNPLRIFYIDMDEFYIKWYYILRKSSNKIIPISLTNFKGKFAYKFDYDVFYNIIISRTNRNPYLNRLGVYFSLQGIEKSDIDPIIFSLLDSSNLLESIESFPIVNDFCKNIFVFSKYITWN